MGKTNWTKIRKQEQMRKHGYEAEPSIAGENRQGWASVVTGRDEDQRGKNPKNK